TAQISGVIGQNGDRDVFKFTTKGGAATFSLDVAQFGPNLDSVLELQNSAGTPLIVSNPSNSFGASLTTNLAAGTYYLVVHSSGGYGNLGRYTVHGNVTEATSTPITLPQPSTPPPATTTTQPVQNTPPPPTATTSSIANDGAIAFTSSGSWNKLSG